MTKVRVAAFAVSLDGFGAGPEQSLENPLGKRGKELHQWFFGTRTFRAMIGQDGGSDGIDERYAHRAMDGFGAFILIFVTEGIEAALDQAKRAANGRDVKIGGGVSTVRQYLRAGMIDELHYVLSPVVLGQGEAMFAGIDLPALGYRVTEHQATEHATHIVLSR